MIGTNRNGCMAVFNVENAGITKKHENKKVRIQMIKNNKKWQNIYQEIPTLYKLDELMTEHN